MSNGEEARERTLGRAPRGLLAVTVITLCEVERLSDGRFGVPCEMLLLEMEMDSALMLRDGPAGDNNTCSDGE